MRCRECNIDLPDNYTACPLCGAKTYADEHKIKGIRYSECPKVETEKYKPSAFPFFLALWAVVGVLASVLQNLNMIDATQAAFVYGVPPVLWTLIGRCLFVKQLHVGNYVVMNIWSLAFFECMLGKAGNVPVNGFATAVPVTVIFVLTALLICALADKKHGHRNAPYAVLIGGGSLLALLVILIREGFLASLWIAALGMAAIVLGIILIRCKERATEEIKAKFTIQ